MYYVYIYFIDSIALYVGKGKNGRFLSHLKGKTTWAKHLQTCVDANKDINCVLTSTRSDAEACALERVLIARYGRADLGLGTLWNKTNGGQGASGAKYDKERMAKSWATRRANGTDSHSPEARARISAAGVGRKASADTRLKMSQSQMGVAKPKAPEYEPWNKGLRKSDDDRLKGNTKPNSTESYKKMWETRRQQ